MAEQALKSIPHKALKKIVREGKLSALLASTEGRAFFDQYLRDKPEFLKYWEFQNLVTELTSADSLAQQLDLADRCYREHIAIEAENRIDEVLDRSIVNKVKKTLDTCRQEEKNPSEPFQNLAEKSLEHLDQQVFRPNLILALSSAEKKNRPIQCDLS